MKDDFSVKVNGEDHVSAKLVLRADKKPKELDLVQETGPTYKGVGFIILPQEQFHVLGHQLAGSPNSLRLAAIRVVAKLRAELFKRLLSPLRVAQEGVQNIVEVRIMGNSDSLSLRCQNWVVFAKPPFGVPRRTFHDNFSFFVAGSTLNYRLGRRGQARELTLAC
jgi:hypothetical protein